MIGAWKGWLLALSVFALFLPTKKDVVSAAQVSQAEPFHDDADQLRRQSVMCGPNCLYMLLALHDVSVHDRSLAKDITSHSEGMSLLALQEACGVQGLRTEVRRCSIDELRRTFQSPVIAHLNSRHYVVVIDMTDDFVTVLDGTTGEKRTIPNQHLSRLWTGYVLIVDSGVSASWVFMVVSAFVWLLVGWFVRRRFSGDNGR
jgi:ABC-type bacteriocin/lantibiotic exporter with double-glycine peptidase domain